MSAPTARLLRLLSLLQAHGQLSGPDLAQRLGVNGRSIRRDMQRLVDMGIPVRAVRGLQGGYALAPGYKLPPLMLDADEALAVGLGLLAAQKLRLSPSVAAQASAQAKLLRVMPLALQVQLQAVNDHVHLDMQAAGTVDASADRLMLMSQAIETGQCLHMRYVNTGAERSDRVLNPYALVFRGGAWYVVGFCHLRQSVRSFRVDRMESVQLGSERFERPQPFDPVQHLRQSIARMPRAHSVRVRLHTDAVAAHHAVPQSLGDLELTSDGVLLHAQVDDLDWMARELAHLPMACSVLHPPALKTALVQLAQRMLTATAATEPLSPGSPAWAG